MGLTFDKINAIFRYNFVDDVTLQAFAPVCHRGGANYAFADGHVKWFKVVQTGTGAQDETERWRSSRLWDLADEHYC